MSVESVQAPSCSQSWRAALDCPAAAGTDHHLWWNNGTLWIAFVVIRDGYRQERVRLSLGTSDLVVARRRRDAILREWAQRMDCVLALRIRCPEHS